MCFSHLISVFNFSDYEIGQAEGSRTTNEQINKQNKLMDTSDRMVVTRGKEIWGRMKRVEVTEGN